MTTPTLTPAAVPIRLRCPACGDPAEVRRGPHGLEIACPGCRERDELPFANTCRLCRDETDGRAMHEDCLRKKGRAA